MFYKLISIYFIGLMSISCAYTQGMHVSAGSVLGMSSLDGLSLDGSKHKGYRIGIDGHLMGDGMYFLAGAHYIKFDMNPSSETSYSNHNVSVDEVLGRFGLGFQFYKTRRFKLRGKLLGGIHYIHSRTNVVQVPAPYSELNEAYGGVIVGLGVDLMFFTIDIEYEKGVVNVVNMASDSNIDFLYFTVGFFF